MRTTVGRSAAMGCALVAAMIVAGGCALGGGAAGGSVAGAGPACGCATGGDLGSVTAGQSGKVIKETVMMASENGAAESAELPKKAIVGTCKYAMWGAYPGVGERLKQLGGVIDEMAKAAKERYGRGLDLAALPEVAVTGGMPLGPKGSLEWKGEVGGYFAAKAREHNCYILVAMGLKESDTVATNACVLVDRQGRVAGIYRKVHVVAGYDNDVLEGGTTPGRDFPVWETDFGRIGAQICFDVNYEDGWRELGRKGARLVVWSTQSPGQVTAASHAMQNEYYVMTSNWRNNATIVDPLGIRIAEITAPQERVLVQELDLEYEVVPWQPKLQNGAALKQKYGDRVGFRYSEAEDGGVFWSNDPKTPIRTMLDETGIDYRSGKVERDRQLQDAARGGPPIVGEGGLNPGSTEPGTASWKAYWGKDMGSGAAVRTVAPGESPAYLETRPNEPHPNGKPRKVVVATVCHSMYGKFPGLDARCAELGGLIDRLADESQKKYGRGPDLVVMSEFALNDMQAAKVSGRAVPVDSPAFDAFRAKARQHKTYLVIPAIVKDGERYYNRALLLDRQGRDVGHYDKVHAVPDGSPAATFEGGTTPGSGYPVFDCDFGRMGMQICFDYCHPEGWHALAAAGAELVVHATQSPSVSIDAARAFTNRIYVVTSTWRTAAAVIEPTGMTAARIGPDEKTLVQEIDLEYRLLPWHPKLRDGEALKEKYGDKVGYHYYPSEDLGIFWSNDPSTPIDAMRESLGVGTHDEYVTRARGMYRATTGHPEAKE